MVLHEKGKEKGGMEKEKNKIKKKNEPTSDFAAFFFSPSFAKGSTKRKLKPWVTALGFPMVTIPQRDPFQNNGSEGGKQGVSISEQPPACCKTIARSTQVLWFAAPKPLPSGQAQPPSAEDCLNDSRSGPFFYYCHIPTCSPSVLLEKSSFSPNI